MTEAIYFADLAHSGGISSAETFPLGIGYVAAYAKQEFGPNIECTIVRDPQELNEALEDAFPRVMCFSNFCWNLNLTMAYAKYIKNISPETTIVMGGLNIPIRREEKIQFLKNRPEIDFYVKWDGEFAFAKLYSRLLECGFNADAIRRQREFLPNLLYLIEGELVEGPDQRITDFSQFPSPYTAGMFDKFFGRRMRPIMETIRGCPYSCTFCNDSDTVRSKVVRRSAEYIRQELEYIAKHVNNETDFLFADLNFGMFKEDLQTARIVRSIIDQYNWPRYIDVSIGKSHPERCLETVNIINGNDRSIVKFIASQQSTDQTVLKNIERKNLALDKIAPLISKSREGRENSTWYFTEFILALPGDSKERHYHSLRDGLEVLRMNSLDVHQLNLAMGTPMHGQVMRSKFGLDVRYRVFVGRIGNYKIGKDLIPVAEVDEVSVGTNEMSFDDWLDCRVTNLLIKIYLDRDYFIEIFGVVEYLGLSPFDLLLHLQDEFLDENEEFAELIDRFLFKTCEPLKDSMEEFEAFALRQDTVEKYLDGRLGGNEMVVHRALAYAEYHDGIHDVLQKAAISYLNKHGFGDTWMKAYIDEAVKFSGLRKFDIENYDKPKFGEFRHDFNRGMEQNFSVHPQDLKISRTEYKFYFRPEQIKEVAFYLRAWLFHGDSHKEWCRDDGDIIHVNLQRGLKSQREFCLGKLFHMVNYSVLKRSVEPVETSLSEYANINFR